MRRDFSEKYMYLILFLVIETRVELLVSNVLNYIFFGIIYAATCKLRLFFQLRSHHMLYFIIYNSIYDEDSLISFNKFFRL